MAKQQHTLGYTVATPTLPPCIAQTRLGQAAQREGAHRVQMLLDEWQHFLAGGFTTEQYVDAIKGWYGTAKQYAEYLGLE